MPFCPLTAWLTIRCDVCASQAEIRRSQLTGSSGPSALYMDRMEGSPGPRMPPPPKEPTTRSGPALDGTGPVVRLSVSIRRDGTASIRALPPAAATAAGAASSAPKQQAQSNFSAWEAAEAEETMRMLRWVESSSGRPSMTSTSGSAQRPSSVPSFEPDEVVQMPEIPEEVIDISSQNAMSSIDGEDATSLTIFATGGGGERGGESATMGSGRPRGGSYDYEDDEDAGMGGGLSEMFSELSRVPALIETIGRDQLIFHVPDDESGFLQQQASRMASGSPFSAAGASRGGGPPLWGGSELQTPFPTDEAYGDDDGEEIASTFELVVPVPRKQEVTSGGGGGGASERIVAVSGSILPSETFNLLADQVAQSVVRNAFSR